MSSTSKDSPCVTLGWANPQVLVWIHLLRGAIGAGLYAHPELDKRVSPFLLNSGFMLQTGKIQDADTTVSHLDQAFGTEIAKNGANGLPIGT